MKHTHDTKHKPYPSEVRNLVTLTGTGLC